MGSDYVGLIYLVITKAIHSHTYTFLKVCHSFQFSSHLGESI